MSAAEKKAMDLEIQRQLAEYDQKHLVEIDAMILWVLHERFGFGPPDCLCSHEEYRPRRGPLSETV